MGVKGLYTVLISEPTRFGRNWCMGEHCSQNNEGSNIYIDGPALHHHLTNSYCSDTYEKLPPSVPQKASTVLRHVSPFILYQLSKAFFDEFHKAGATSIHLVFDGVASIHKKKQQVKRLQETCGIADRAARRFIRGDTSSKMDPVIHLWGEEAMEAALKDLSKNLNKDEVFHVHWASGEAEGFIVHHLLPKSYPDGCQDIILSNDSDFLVFNSVPGFVPLESLKFCPSKDGSCLIKGWEYCRFKLMAAFPALNITESDSNNFPMTVCAALAGCDYTLPSTFEQCIVSARQVIVRSDIGGLRKKNRNSPTARAVFIAVMRYVSHFVKRNEGDWRNQLVQAIVRNPGGLKNNIWLDSNLMRALDMIQDIYMEEGNRNMLVPDLRRILYHRVLFCKPLIETCDIYSKGASRDKAVRHSNKKVNSTSIWMEQTFLRCRQHLYSMMRSVSPQTIPPSTVVTEYCCFGKKNQITYNGFEVSVTTAKGPSGLCVLDCLFPQHIESVASELVGMLDTALPSRYHFTVVTSLLLTERRDVLMLFLISYVPLPSERVSVNVVKTLLNRKEFLLSTGRIQLALFHAKLMMNVSNMSEEWYVMKKPSIPIHKMFHDDLIMQAWASLIATLEVYDESCNTEDSDFLDQMVDDLILRMYKFTPTDDSSIHDDLGSVNFMYQQIEWKSILRSSWLIWYTFHEKCHTSE